MMLNEWSALRNKTPEERLRYWTRDLSQAQPGSPVMCMAWALAEIESLRNAVALHREYVTRGGPPEPPNAKQWENVELPKGPLAP
jgi:hypothetical protein